MTQPPEPRRKRTGPWLAPPYDPANAYAMQALSRGDASPHQQRKALDFIVKTLCRAESMSFEPPAGNDDGRRASDFAEGKRWIAYMIRKHLLPVPDHFLRRTADGAPIMGEHD